MCVQLALPNVGDAPAGHPGVWAVRAASRSHSLDKVREQHFPSVLPRAA